MLVGAESYIIAIDIGCSDSFESVTEGFTVQLKEILTNKRNRIFTRNNDHYGNLPYVFL